MLVQRNDHRHPYSCQLWLHHPCERMFCESIEVMSHYGCRLANLLDSMTNNKRNSRESAGHTRACAMSTMRFMPDPLRIISLLAIDCHGSWRAIGLGAEDWRHLKNILTMESHFIHLPSGHHRFCLYLSPSTSPCFPRRPNFQRNELKLAESKQENSTEPSFPALSHHRIPYHSVPFVSPSPSQVTHVFLAPHLRSLCLATRRGRNPWATSLANEKRGTGHASPFFRAKRPVEENTQSLDSNERGPKTQHKNKAFFCTACVALQATFCSIVLHVFLPTQAPCHLSRPHPLGT